MRRRNVFKVGVAYAIVASIIAQGADLVFPRLGLDEWTVTLVIALLILGFPVALVLAWAYEVTPEGVKRTKDVPLAASLARMSGQKLNYWITILLAVAVGFLIADDYVFEERGTPNGPAESNRFTPSGVTGDERGPVRFSVTPPAGVSVTQGPGLGMSSLAVSPDGGTLTFAGTACDKQQLYQRSTDSRDVTPLDGTEGATGPFYSPDGSWIGFFADGQLKRIRADGGSPIPITDVQGYPTGASWGEDDRIVFSGGTASALQIVDVTDGDVGLLTELRAGERDHERPEFLPGTDVLLFESGEWIHGFDMARSRRVPELVEGQAPRYAGSGYLLLGRGADVLAARLDLDDLDVGTTVTAVPDVAVTGGIAYHYALSRSGTLAYLPAAGAYELVLVEPDGDQTRETILDTRRGIQNPRFSDDGRRLVVAVSDRSDRNEDMNLWLYDLDAGTSRPLTFDGGRAPVWGPDGETVTYSHLGDEQGIYTIPVDLSRTREQVRAIPTGHWLVGWADDETLAYGRIEEQTADDESLSSVVALTGDEPDIVVDPGDIWGGRLSPDGEWLVYYERAPGPFDVFVVPFSGVGQRHLITTEGTGRDPAWSPDGSEIYFVSGNCLMAAEVDMAAGVEVQTTRTVYEPFSPPRYDDYDIADDGTLVLVRPFGNRQAADIVMVVNWLPELRELMP